MRSINNEMGIEMKNERFKSIYEMAKIKELEELKKEYQRLKETSDMFDSFEDFLKEVEQLESKISEEKTPKTYKAIEDCYIYKDVISKDGIECKLHLIRFPFYSSAELDENYKSIPLTEKILYECGLTLVMGDYCINNVFSNVSENETKMKNFYNEFLQKIKDSSIDSILDDVEKYLKK